MLKFLRSHLFSLFTFSSEISSFTLIDNNDDFTIRSGIPTYNIIIILLPSVLTTKFSILIQCIDYIVRPRANFFRYPVDLQCLLLSFGFIDSMLVNIEHQIRHGERPLTLYRSVITLQLRENWQD